MKLGYLIVALLFATNNAQAVTTAHNASKAPVSTATAPAAPEARAASAPVPLPSKAGGKAVVAPTPADPPKK